MKDIDDIRRENLRRIEKEAGSPSFAAHLLGMSPAQFTNLRDGARDSKTGKPRGMRKTTAREIEAKVGKPVGWLDIDHSDASAAVVVSAGPKGWDQLTDDERAAFQALVDAVLAGLVALPNTKPRTRNPNDRPSID